MKQSNMIIRCSICIFCTIVHLNSFSQLFYYGFDKKILLTPKTNEYAIKFKSTSVADNFKQKFSFINKIDSATFVIQNISDVFKNDINIVSVYPVCKVNNQTEIYPTNEIIFKYRDLKDTLLLNATLEKFNVTLKEITPYYIIVETNKQQDVFITANKMYESGVFYYAYPNFIVNAVLSTTIPADQFFNKQFYLYNTGQTINDGHVCTAGIDINATKAWDITKGKTNITIAVIDEGISGNHPDLPNTRQLRLNGSNFESLNGLSVNDPSPLTYHAHGNACAGIIAASHNSEGVAGIAPECKIMPITFPYISGFAFRFANAINFAVTNGAQIISNSWNFRVDDPNYLPVIVDAIQNAITNNRIVVFSAGNFVSQPGYVMFPANVNINGVLAVGACDRNGNQSLYSPTDIELDFVAPSAKGLPGQTSGETNEVWSMDSPNNDGFNPCSSTCDAPSFTGEQLPNSGTNYLSYTGRMGGTSAACPQVAGVAALMLSINPCILPAAIETMLKNSCKKIGSIPYVSGRNNNYGFGLIDAFEAVKLAIQSASIFFKNQTLTGTNIYQASYGIYAGSHPDFPALTGLTTIATNANIIFKATQEIYLGSDFEVQLGAIFEVQPELIVCQ